jgi:hypothetical protein
MYVCIMHQCFGVGTSYGFWLGLTIHAYGWGVTAATFQKAVVGFYCRKACFLKSCLARKLRLFGNPAFLMRICCSSCKLCIIPLIVVFVISIYICNCNTRKIFLQ